jgi:hypothetical protein
MTSSGMSEVEELNIVKNKIDRIEDFSIPSPNVIRSINLVPISKNFFFLRYCPSGAPSSWLYPQVLI